MSVTLQELYDASVAADRAYDTLEHERRAAVHDATNAVHEQFAERMQDAEKLRADAKRALERAREEQALASPLVGRKVMRPAKPGSWRLGNSGKPKAHGVIEAYRAGDPKTRDWGIHPGDLVIRYLKKDGSPAIRCEPVPVSNGLPYGWKFVEEGK